MDDRWMNWRVDGCAMDKMSGWDISHACVLDLSTAFDLTEDSKVLETLPFLASMTSHFPCFHSTSWLFLLSPWCLKLPLTVNQGSVPDTLPSVFSLPRWACLLWTSFIYVFHKYLLSIYHMPDIVPGRGHSGELWFSMSVSPGSRTLALAHIQCLLSIFT